MLHLTLRRNFPTGTLKIYTTIIISTQKISAKGKEGKERRVFSNKVLINNLHLLLAWTLRHNSGALLLLEHSPNTPSKDEQINQKPNENEGNFIKWELEGY